jgi:hypothetical protein
MRRPEWGIAVFFNVCIETFEKIYLAEAQSRKERVKME